MGKHDIEMTAEEQQAAIQIARGLAPLFDAVGPLCDERNEFCHELVEPYRESGLVGIAVPKRFGGGGADVLTLTQISRELARGDPACALAFNMHQTMVGIFRGLLSEEMQQTWMPRIAAGAIVCGPFSEERAGFAGLADTTAVPDGRGNYVINGAKSWATLCLAADVIAFNASVLDEDAILPADHLEHAESEQVFCLDMTTPGIRIEETWDTLGMKATGTHTVHFEDVTVPMGEAIVGDFRGGLFGEFEWAAMTFAGCYLGLGDKAYDHAVATLRRKSLGATMEGADVTLRDVGYVQNGVGRMAALNAISERVVEATGQWLIDGRDAGLDVMERLAHVDIVKVAATENSLDVVDQGMRLIGGSTYRRGATLERLFRDARSGPFHPLTTDQEHALLGKLALGLLDPPDEGRASAHEAAVTEPTVVTA